MNIKLRPFEAEDQTAVKLLILQGLEEHWGWIDASLNPDLDKIELNFRTGHFVTAWDNNELVGAGGIHPEQPGICRIERMSVSRKARRQKIGSLIVDDLICCARASGAKKVVLETTSSWQSAIEFYASRGFHVMFEKDGDTHFDLVLN